MFDEKTQQALGYYVYMLIDPSNNKPFYVGKGKNNRVFDHIEHAVKNPSDCSDKCDTIRAIGADKVVHVIVTHGLKTEDEAFKIEAVLIDVLNHYYGSLLTNEQSGHHVNETGIMTADEIERLYNAKQLNKIGDDCVIININGQYNRAMGKAAIYNATKECWRMDKDKVKKIKYVLSEYRGLIVEVFEVDEWYTKKRQYGPSSKKAGQLYDGWGFDGKIAPAAIRDLYINKSIAHKKVQGRANPITYSL